MDMDYVKRQIQEAFDRARKNRKETDKVTEKFTKEIKNE